MAITLVASVSAATNLHGYTTAAIDTTGANLLVISATWYAGVTPAVTVSDSKGNTWTPLTRHTGPTDGRHQFFYSLTSPIVGTGHTFTVSGTSTYSALVVYAFAGVHGGVGGESGNGHATTGPIASGSVTPATDGALVPTAMGSNDANASGDSVAPGGFTTTIVPAVVGTSMQNASAYYVQPTAAAINPTWSWTGTHTIIAVSTAVFRATAPPPAIVGIGRGGAGATAALNTTGAGLIVLSTGAYGGTTSVSDSKGNTWIPLTTHVSTLDANAKQQLFYCLAPTVGTGHTFTVGGSVPAIVALAVAGGWTYQTESGAGGNITVASGSVTPAANGALLVGGLGASDPGADAVSPGVWTLLAVPFVTSVNMQAAVAYLVQPTAAAINPTWGTTSGTHSLMAVGTAVFLPVLTATVPNVVGLTAAAADAALVAVGLVSGTVTTASDPVVPSGDVISQSPTAGSTVAIGSGVDYVVSTGPALTTVPNVVGMTTAAADAALVAVGLTTGTLTTATHPTAPAGTVISQSPTAGSSVAPGSAVALVISLGPLDQSIKPEAIVEVELDGVDNGWTALTADVLRAPGIVIRRGIDETRPDARVASTGTASFGLNNSASNDAGLLGYYSPHHVNLRDGFGLGIRCRVSLQSPDLVWRVQFLGRLDAIDPLPGAHGARQVLVTAVDWLDEAARWRLTPAIGEQIDQSWDAVLTALLAQMPVQPAAISLNGGSETWPYALDTSEIASQTALAEFVKLAHSEYGLIYQRADGTLRAEDRHFRMTTTAAVWTLTDADLQDLELPSTRDDLLNTIRVTTHPRTVSPVANVIVYEQANVIEFAACETKMLMGSYRDPVTGDAIGATELQPQVVGTDIIANAAADGTGANVSSSIGVVIEAGQSGVRFDVTNGTGAPAFLTTLRLIGKGIYDHGATVHEATDAASISLHGEHALDYDMPYQVRQDVGQAAAEYILAKYKDPLAQAHSLTVIGRTPELLLQILTRDISDRITLSETVTGADDTYFINAVELTIHTAGHASARYTLTPADDPATLAGYFILDVSSLDGPDILAPF